MGRMKWLLLGLVCGIFPAQAAPASKVSIEQYLSHDFQFTAPVQANPFDVELAGEFSGPDGAHLRIPGFYDGAGVWKIRFAPNQQGEWSLRTVSPAAPLDGKTETGILCGPNRQPETP